ncbi:ABC transporter permease [Spongiimicrobium salis]|uniref:ABC transporter permease n=1 Tax=Spongiimicrobium salis TaxID=1667022 RepID=UPI00374DB1C4
MNIWKISIQNIKSNPLYTVLSIFTLSLSISLLLGIQQLKTSFQYQMENNLGAIDLVIGAKGSPLQLVLASVLHLDNPTGNISHEEAKKIGKNPMVKMAVPISYGDNYKGFRILGTTSEFIAFYNGEIREGRPLHKSMEVVLGHTVADKLQLHIGDSFLSSHGLVANDFDVHDEELVVVGILKPTQKVIDRLIITKLESVRDVHNHTSHDGEADENEEKHALSNVEEEENHPEHQGDHHEGKEITSLLISFRNPRALLTLPRKINKDTNMQAALPKYELDKLYQYTGIGFKTISWIAYIILIISGAIIFISFYKMIKERAFDLALLRTYGASALQLVKMVAYEGLIIGSFAFVIGFLCTKAGLYFMFNVLENGQQHHMLQGLPLGQIVQLMGLVLAMIILSISLAIYPIIKMNISNILSHEK